MPYATYFFCKWHFPLASNIGEEMQNTEAGIIILRSLRNLTCTLARAGQLQHKHNSPSPFFGAAHGACGLLNVKLQWKGQGTLINFTQHSHLLWTCLTFTQPHLVTSPLKHPGGNSHLMSVSRLPPPPPLRLSFFSALFRLQQQILIQAGQQHFVVVNQ